MEIIIIGKVCNGGSPLAEVMVGLDYFIVNGTPRNFGDSISTSGNVPLTGSDGLFGLYYDLHGAFFGEIMGAVARIFITDFNNGRRAPFHSRFGTFHQNIRLMPVPNIHGLMTAAGLSVGTASRALGQRVSQQQRSQEQAQDSLEQEAVRILDRIGLSQIITILNAAPRLVSTESHIYLGVMNHDF